MANIKTLIAATAAGGLTAALLLILKKMNTKPLKNSTTTNPLAGRISQGFHSGHTAVDIAVPVGTEICAPWDGRVIKLWDDTVHGGGLSLRIRHDNGYTTGYAHLSSCLLALGDRVQQGQPVALSGNTGFHTTGPHLHFVLCTPAGKRIDPQSVFSFQA